MGIIAILYGEIHNRTDCCPATKRQDDWHRETGIHL